MASVVMYGNEYFGQIDNGLTPAHFKYRFLVEGDSWMDRSSMFHTSLLQCLAPEFDAENDDVMFVNVSMFGDTMRRMGSQATGDFASWLNDDLGWKFDAVLLSAGGNDFIDAARDPAAGLGILKDFNHQPQPASGHGCIDRNAVGELVTRWLDPNFKRLYEVVRRSRYHADIPIFLNNYDTPTARYAPAFTGGRSWLEEAYNTNHIPKHMWPDLTDSIFNDVQTTIAGWTFGRSKVFTVPTDGVLTPSAAGSTGSDADWLNEIHPNAAGWAKLAKIWHATLKTTLN
jgi:lysophospholipase L1-like esterase